MKIVDEDSSFPKEDLREEPVGERLDLMDNEDHLGEILNRIR